jgi:hypothetical protein
MSDSPAELPAARPKLNPPVEVAPGVHRLGTNLVNFHAITPAAG